MEWLLIVHLWHGGWAEPHASELSCALALAEVRTIGRLMDGRAPAAVCREMSWGEPRPARARRITRAAA